MDDDLKIYFFTGASGAGKTKLFEALAKENFKAPIVFLHFDKIGVPSEEEMIKQYGSGEGWQKAMTFKWVQKILTEYKDNQIILFEGQVNLDFVEEAFKKNNFNDYKIILVHCSNEERHKRLSKQRMQPELVNKQMDNWANYLLKQAQEKGALILDTSGSTIRELVSWCKNSLNL